METLPEKAINISARGLRYGGTQEIQNHINAGALAAVVRGGWALEEKETRNTSSTYSVGNFNVLMFWSKAIAGYPDARAPVYSPSLNILYKKQPDGIEKIGLLMTEIFQQCSHFNLLDSPLKSFPSGMLAAFLRFYEEFEQFVGVHNPILVRFHNISRKCGISNAQIRVWSKLVREQFDTDNLLHNFDKVSRANNEVVNVIVHMHNAVLRVEESNRQILSQLQFCIQENQTLKSMLEENRRDTQDFRRENMMIDTGGSPSQRKKQRHSSQVSPAESSAMETSTPSNKEAAIELSITELQSTSVTVSNPVAPRNAFEVISRCPPLLIDTTSIGLDELIPKLFDHQMSYSICVDKRRKREITSAMEYIKRRLNPQEIEIMKRKPPESNEQSKIEREEWLKQKRKLCTSIVKRLKECVHKERGGKVESKCTLSAIGDFIIKERVLNIDLDLPSSSSSSSSSSGDIS